MKGKKQQKKEEMPASEGGQKVAQVFSLTRDIEVAHPYHMDGDIEMYDQEQLAARQKLHNDPDILKLLAQIVELYEWSEVQNLGKVILEPAYKKIQRQLALILRPSIDSEELTFIVDADWEHDRIEKDGKRYMDKNKVVEGLFQLVDVWTMGIEKQQYQAFCKLLKKKLERALKIKS